MKKRKDGYYQRKITYKKQIKIVYGKSKDELDKKEKQFKKEVENFEKSQDLFVTWLDKWWEYHKQRIKYNTIDSYIRPVEDVREEFKDKLLVDIKPSDIKKFISELEQKQYARQTINLRYIVLCKTFDFAIENDVDVSNVARAVKLPNGLPKSKRETLTDEQIEVVKSSNNLFANFLLYTGCRKNEAFAITWEDIDFDKNTIKIDKSIVWVNNKPVISTPKTESGERIIPLLAPLKNLLQKEQLKKGYVFNANNKPLEKKQARSMWDSYIKQIGINITPHQFRHAFITLMYNADIDVKTAQAIGGHSKVDVMLNIYTHLDNKNQNKAREKLDMFLAK